MKHSGSGQRETGGGHPLQGCAVRASAGSVLESAMDTQITPRHWPGIEAHEMPSAVSMHDDSIVRIEDPDDQTLHHECRWIDFESDNREMWDDDMESCRTLAVGESRNLGGGAVPLMTFRRIT